MKKFLALVTMAIVAVSAFAQGGMKMPSIEESVNKMDTQIGLKLTAAQKTKVGAIIKDVQTQAMALTASSKGPNGQIDMAKLQANGPMIKKKSEAIKSNMLASMKKVLTADQYKKFDTYMKDQEAKMKQRMPAAPGKGGKG